MKAFIHRIVGASLVFLTGTLAAQTRCAVESFGSIDQDPLTIAGDFVLPAECTLDFGDRAVILEGSLRALDLTLLAGQLTVLEKGLIEGGPGATTLVLRRSRLHDGSIEIGGALLNDGVHGGAIDIQCDGSVTVATGAQIEASGKDPSGYGGFISIAAGGDVSFLPDGTPLRAVGGELAEFNGEVSIISHNGSVDLKRGIEVSGGTLFPGVVTIEAADKLTTGIIRAPGNSVAGLSSRAGLVNLSSGGDMQVGAILAAGSDDNPLDAGDGNGGRVRIDAGGSVFLDGDIDLSAGEWSQGGSFEAFAGASFRQAGKSLDVSGLQPDSRGGFIIISAGKDASFSGVTSANGGGAGAAGSIQVIADQVLSIDGNFAADGNFPSAGIELVSVNDAIKITGALTANGPGDFGTGGPIGLFAVTSIDISGPIHADGSGPYGLGGPVTADSFASLHVGGSIESNGDLSDPKIGEGGTIDLKACQVIIDRGVLLQASGEIGGGIFITSSDGMALPGQLQAPSDGLIQIKFPTDLPPDLSGGTFVPDPILVPVDSLDPCALPTACDPVTDLACAAQGTSATLTWSNSPTNTAVQVLRDRNVVTTLGPTDESFIDHGLAVGPHSYAVQGSCRGRPAAGASCDVTISTDVPFRRGDCNASGDRDISDAVTVLGYLYLGVPKSVKCEKACDCNDDGGLDVSDAVFLLAYLFTDPTKIPPPPLERCGLDLKPDRLTCESFGVCQQ